MQTDYEDERVRVSRVVVGPIDNNVYFVTCQKTGDSMMIDAANEADLLLEWCNQLSVKQVVETHGHWDHIGAVKDVRNAGLPVAVGAVDADALDGYDEIIESGRVFKIGELEIAAYATPGHTPGSICFAVTDAPLLFTGDTLFPGGPGATHFPGGDFNTIIDSLSKLFEIFNDSTKVFPGHGASTTIGTERPQLPVWAERGW